MCLMRLWSLTPRTFPSEASSGRMKSGYVSESSGRSTRTVFVLWLPWLMITGGCQLNEGNHMCEEEAIKTYVDHMIYLIYFNINYLFNFNTTRSLNILRYTVSRCLYNTKWWINQNYTFGGWKTLKNPRIRPDPRKAQPFVVRVASSQKLSIIGPCQRVMTRRGMEYWRLCMLKHCGTMWPWATVVATCPFAKSSTIAPFLFSEVNPEEMAAGQSRPTYRTHARTPLSSFHQPCRRKKVQGAHLGTKRMQISMRQGAQTVGTEKRQLT